MKFISYHLYYLIYMLAFSALEKRDMENGFITDDTESHKRLKNSSKGITTCCKDDLKVIRQYSFLQRHLFCLF